MKSVDMISAVSFLKERMLENRKQKRFSDPSFVDASYKSAVLIYASQKFHVKKESLEVYYDGLSQSFGIEKKVRNGIGWHAKEKEMVLAYTSFYRESPLCYYGNTQRMYRELAELLGRSVASVQCHISMWQKKEQFPTPEQQTNRMERYDIDGELMKAKEENRKLREENNELRSAMNEVLRILPGCKVS